MPRDKSAPRAAGGTLRLLVAQAMNPESCKHARTILVAKDEHEEYRECLDCGEIFDPSETNPPAGASFGESLSDA